MASWSGRLRGSRWSAVALTPGATESARTITLGLRANWRQFWLLVLVNAFVGAMIGLERTVLPLLAQAEFGLASKSAALSFIATFGIVKALTNYFAGRLSDRYGRKPVLLAGWCFALPVPFLVIWAPSWSWVVFANVLLGINQGLAWSTTVIMKIDLVGPRQRGLAMGLNEFAGYLAVALAALATGYLAHSHGLRPEPFYLGIACAASGLGLSLVFVRETRHHAVVEAEIDTGGAAGQGRPVVPSSRELLTRAAWGDPALSSVSQAGMVNNLNDGLAWGLFPLFFAAAGLNVAQIGVLSFIYPAVWGGLQPWTGVLSDRWGRKPLIGGGMLLQSGALAAVAVSRSFWPWVGAAALLGLGTAMVYPALLAAVGDVAQPSWRGSAVGVYRLWRDGGYAVGALLAGALADLFGMSWSIGVVAILTFVSGLLVVGRMPETLTPARGAVSSAKTG
ncbi:MAG TPA: MFS transporter [Actinomycetota bacterium]|nr:MFS transporter [Actinomycetota bacterium]